MSDVIIDPYGYEEDAVSQQALGVFLNEKVRVTRFEKEVGEDLRPYLVVEFTATNGATKAKRFYEITKTMRDNKEITDLKNPALLEEIKKQNATITHVVKRFVSEEIFKGMPRSKGFEDYINNLVKLVSMNNPEFSTVELDLFAHYQWSIGKGTNKTWPEVPRNMKQGPFLCQHVEPVGAWHLTINEDAGDNAVALFYTDDAGNRHPLSRSGWFVKSNYANQQTQEGDDGYDYTEDAATTQGDAAASGETW